MRSDSTLDRAAIERIAAQLPAPMGPVSSLRARVQLVELVLRAMRAAGFRCVPADAEE
jgi:hypothetical protein